MENAKEEIKPQIRIGNAIALPFKDNSFDFVYNLGSMHNLYNFELFKTLKEMERVCKQHKYIMQESYRNETERITCVTGSWLSIHFTALKNGFGFLAMPGYTGDYGFIFFE